MFVVAVSAKVAFDSSLQVTCLLFVRADDEDGVVAGDGAYYFWPVFIVDSGGDGLSASGGGDEDEKVNGLTNFEAKAFEDLADSGESVFVGVVSVGKRVAGWPFI